ncbi:transcriptional regulator [Candidatus Gottesmanbacteria bacterium]|nr:transcriptional regulator [Candidatus Gottesmanbacteria bacterium]
MYPTKNDKALIHAVSLLQNKKDIECFLRDLLTSSEIEEFSSRFAVAILLWTTKKSYLEIAKEVNTSTTTVTRVSAWLYKEPWQGYSKVLSKLYGKSIR